MCSQFWNLRSEIRVSAWSSSSEESLPGLQTATLSLYVYMAFPWCILCVCVCVSEREHEPAHSGVSSYNITNPIMGVQPSWPHITLITS